jgi:hypothetical protein
MSNPMSNPFSNPFERMIDPPMQRGACQGPPAKESPQKTKRPHVGKAIGKLQKRNIQL